MTPKTQIPQALQVALPYIRILADSLVEGFCFVNARGIVLVWNKRAAETYGVQSSAILGRPISEFFPNALIEEVRRTRAVQIDMDHEPREGSHILISAMPVYMDGKFIGAISTERDHEDMIRLGKKLEDAEAKVLFLQKEMLKSSGLLSSIVGNAPNFLKKIEIAQQIAPTDTNIMITGESGTGKEVFAQGIHELSGRKGLFIPINCSAIPSELFESEFFGYMPGSFTGASAKGKAGFFELAHGGTLFLDEIGDMPYPAQAKLLRVLQENVVMRIGSSELIPIDVRVISATNRNLKAMMREERSFREDLYYRLNVLEIHIPSLTERPSDIPLLVDHFMKLYTQKNGLNPKKITPAAMEVLSQYHWPGNVRELMNIIENMVVIHRQDTISVDDIPSHIHTDKHHPDTPDYPMDLTAAIRMLETGKILEAVEQCQGNKSKAAQLLNIPRATLYKKIKDYNLFT